MTSPDFTARPEPLPVAEPEPLLTPAPTPPDRLKLLQLTIYEALMLMVFNMIIGSLLQALHLDVFLASEANVKALERMRHMNPLLLLGLAVVAAPIIEEAIFRGLPYLLSKRVTRHVTEPTRSRLYWLLGGSGAMLFAVAHGAGSLPVPQLVLGLWSWHVINTRGLRYSMVLHASYNLVPILLMLSVGNTKVS